MLNSLGMKGKDEKHHLRSPERFMELPILIFTILFHTVLNTSVESLRQLTLFSLEI